MKNLLILLGFMALIVPGIIFSIRLLFLNLIIALEDTKNVLRRSKLLSKGILLKIILSVLFLTAIIAVPLIILGIGVYLMSVGWLGDTIFDVLIDLTGVLYIILTLLIYLE